MTERQQLSQASLQDYLDCRRRFYLRHVLKLDWPAHQTDRAEEQRRRARKGIAFHRLMHQNAIGLPESRLTAVAADAGIEKWWHSFREHPIEKKDAQLHTEISLSAPLGDHRLLAKYDLVSVGASVTIVDWKTSKRRDEEWLAARMQTKVYRYLMVVAGADLHGGVEPSQIEMIYWFAGNPARPVSLPYDRSQFEADERELRGIVAEIDFLTEIKAELTDDETQCRYCVFRPLCDRGVLPGSLDEYETDWDEEQGSIDYEQIQEIAF